MDWQAMMDAFSKGAELLRNSLPEGIWLSPGSAATVAAVGLAIGLILALWGAKLLRFLYVAAFIFAGAYAGIHLARNYAIDDLFGLVVGAAVAGLLGHFFFRWWIGITAGLCAMIIAAAVLGPQILPQLPDDLNAFWDQQQGVGSGDYSDVLRQREVIEEARQKGTLQILRELRAFIWEANPQETGKLTFVLAIAWLVGLAVGALAPRFTTICITSVLGVSLFAIGLSYLLATRLPAAWAFICAESRWALVALGIACLVSLAWQFHARRPIVPATAPAPAA